MTGSLLHRTVWLWSSGERLAGRVEEECRALILRKISCFHGAFQAGRLVNNPGLALNGNFEHSRKEEIP